MEKEEDFHRVSTTSQVHTANGETYKICNRFKLLFRYSKNLVLKAIQFGNST